MLLAALAVKLVGYAPVYPYPHSLLALLSGAALLVSVSFLATGNLQSSLRRALRIASVAIAAITLTFGYLFAMTFLSFENTRCHGIYTSPDKNRQLAVMHFGFIEDFYTAAPCVLGLFYRNSQNVLISRDEQSLSEIEVRWLDDDSARVYIIYDPTVGPVEEDSILVSFN